MQPARRLAAEPTTCPEVEVSVVVPVLDEADNVLPLVAEIRAALAGRRFEVVYVDDGSTDETPARLAEAAARWPELRVLRHDGRYGQSAAIRTGVRAARAPVVVTLDGDGQNDPADIPAMLAALGAPSAGRPVGLVTGQRTRRRDAWLRRVSSRVANGVRSRVLGDGVADTGCGLKAFARETFLDLPYFDHMHRFLPALVQREGYAVHVVPVGHRPRRAGRSKYGTLDRLFAGLVDLAGVFWLRRRARVPRVAPL
ncbi:MAG TPA: glycosyltransferase family 2 protein [Thermodesulfobacteriota bacterium]